MPPEWMWPFDDELESWFDGIASRRDSGEQSAPMMSNSLAPKVR